MSSRRDTWGILSGSAIYSLSLSTASVALPLLALQAGYSAALIGVLTAASALSQMTIRLGLGWAMRRWSDWLLVMVAGLLLALSCGLATLSTGLGFMTAAHLLQGASRACFWTGSQAHVIRGDSSAAASLARVNVVSAAGSLAGPLLAGLLSEVGPRLAMGVATGVAVVGVGPSLLIDRLPPFSPPAERPAGRMWRRPGVELGCWAGMTAGAWRALASSYVPIVLDGARHSTTSIGALVTLANLASVTGVGSAGRIRDRWVRWVLGVGIAVTGVVTSLLGVVAESFVLAALVLVVSGFAAGVVQILGPALATEAVHPEERGDVIAVSGTFRAVALLGAPLAVAGLVLVMPMAGALAIVGLGMTGPLIAFRRDSRDR